MTAPLPSIIFSHANSFSAGTYRVLFAELERRGFRVKALDKFGHDERYPVSNNWPHLVRQLTDFADAEQQKTGAPVFLAGHSLGGFLSLLAAVDKPELASGVLLIDSPILGGWRARGVGMAKSTKLIHAVSPGAISRRRRDSWPDVDAAVEHFRSKKAFARWDPQVLRDYIEHGTVEIDGKRVLGFSREIETAIYNTLPDNMEQLLKRKPLTCPVAYIGGRSSLEMRQVGMGMTEKVTKGRIIMLDGTHLFPMEQPVATAAAIEASLHNLHLVHQHKTKAR